MDFTIFCIIKSLAFRPKHMNSSSSPWFDFGKPVTENWQNFIYNRRSTTIMAKNGFWVIYNRTSQVQNIWGNLNLSVLVLRDLNNLINSEILLENLFQSSSLSCWLFSYCSFLNLNFNSLCQVKRVYFQTLSKFDTAFQ